MYGCLVGILMGSYLFRRLRAPVTMEGLNEKDATSFSAVFNHFHMKINVSPIQVLCYSLFFELIIAQTILDYKYSSEIILAIINIQLLLDCFNFGLTV